MTTSEADFESAWSALGQHGLLLESDPLLPSVATLVGGEPIKGSWWGHPRGTEIYSVTRKLAEHPDVATAKLVSGKVTYLHRRLWPALLAVGTSGEAWQVANLSLAAKAGLSAVQRAGSLRADALPGSDFLRKTALKDLELRLLVHADEIHGEKGAHVKVLETWERWAERVKAPRKRLGVARARQDLDEIVRSLDILRNAKGRLPWWPKNEP